MVYHIFAYVYHHKVKLNEINIKYIQYVDPMGYIFYFGTYDNVILILKSGAFSAKNMLPLMVRRSRQVFAWFFPKCVLKVCVCVSAHKFTLDSLLKMALFLLGLEVHNVQALS